MRRRETLAPGIDSLMHVTCAQWCLGSGLGPEGERVTILDFIPVAGVVTADEFVSWAFKAVEASGPLDERAMWRRAATSIRAAFVQHMGSDEVDAIALRWCHADGTPKHLPLPDPEAFTRNLTDDELLDYERVFGTGSREWILAQRELSRRHGPVSFLGRWLRLGHHKP